MSTDLTLDVLADELYGVPPEQFVEARTAARDRARAAGDRQLATQVAALPKPSTAAWVCNLLAREQPEEIAQLVELGGLLRAAQASLSGDQLKQLGRQRSQVVAALARQARALAAQRGHPVSTAIAEQVEGTLRAAVADEDAGTALTAGRLTGALSYTGIGPVDVSGAVAAAPPRAPAPTTGGRRSATADDADERRRREEERAEQRRREAEQAAADAAEATRVAEDAQAAADEAQQRLTELGARRDETHARVAQLQEELRRAERRATAAEGEVTEQQHRRDAAARRAGTAAAIAERARAHADELARASAGS